MTTWVLIWTIPAKYLQIMLDRFTREVVTSSVTPAAEYLFKTRDERRV